MKIREKIAFVLYMINGILSIVFGFKYLLCDTIMPYHEQAIGMHWTKLDPGLQVLLNGLIKIAASGFIVLGVSVCVLLMIPFRKGETWAMWAVPFLGYIFLAVGLFVTLNIHIQTNASTPWPVLVVTLALTTVALFLSGVFFNNSAVLES